MLLITNVRCSKLLLGFFWALLRPSYQVIPTRSSLTSMSNHFLVLIYGVGEKGTVCNNFDL